MSGLDVDEDSENDFACFSNGGGIFHCNSQCRCAYIQNHVGAMQCQTAEGVGRGKRTEGAADSGPTAQSPVVHGPDQTTRPRRLLLPSPLRSPSMPSVIRNQLALDPCLSSVGWYVKVVRALTQRGQLPRQHSAGNTVLSPPWRPVSCDAVPNRAATPGERGHNLLIPAAGPPLDDWWVSLSSLKQSLANPASSKRTVRSRRSLPTKLAGTSC